MNKAPTAVLIDDEAVLRFALKRQLADVWPQLEVVAEAGDGAQALQCCEKLQPDVVFMDIQMPGLNGLQVAQQLLSDGYSGALVFVTAYDQYAVEAFEREALDYLLKPVSVDRLLQTVKRVQQRIAVPAAPAQGELQQLLRTLVHGDGAPHKTLQWIKASSGEKVLMLAVEDVLCFEAGDKYTTVVTGDGEYLIRMSIKNLEEQLDTEKFWRVHRSTIVQVAKLEHCERDEAGRLQLQLRGVSRSLPVSRSYNHLFKQM